VGAEVLALDAIAQLVRWDMKINAADDVCDRLCEPYPSAIARACHMVSYIDYSV
jgi:hypothetical protein